MKTYEGPRRNDETSKIFQTIRSYSGGTQTRNEAYNSGFAYGTEWARSNHVDVATVQALATSKIETPSSALINEMTALRRTPRSVLIKLGVVLGISTKDIKDRTRKFYIALENYDRGFVQGAVDVVKADNQ